MATRGASNIYSGEPLPVPPKVDDAEVDAFNRKLIDYLRRLTGKLARFSGGSSSGTVSTVALSLSADYPGSLVDYLIPFDNQIQRDSIFELGATLGTVKVLQAGCYSVEHDVTIAKNFQVELRVARVDSGGAEITTEDYAYTSITGPSPGMTYSSCVPLQLSAGDYIGVFIRCTDGISVIDVWKNGTRLLVTRLGDTT